MGGEASPGKIQDFLIGAKQTPLVKKWRNGKLFRDEVSGGS